MESLLIFLVYPIIVGMTLAIFRHWLNQRGNKKK